MFSITNLTILICFIAFPSFIIFLAICYLVQHHRKNKDKKD